MRKTQLRKKFIA